MTRYDDEILMRRIDGELSPDEGAAIDSAALSDPALAARLQALRALRSRLHGAFPAEVDPRDRALAALIAAGPAKRATPFAGLGDRLRDAFAPRLAPVWAGAAAACFVLGLAIGQLGSGDATPASGLVIAADGRIGDPALVRVLDSALAADAPDAGGRAVGLTFQSAEGRWCRTFTDATSDTAGLACRDGGRWALQALASVQTTSTEVRTAGADTPAPVLAAVDALIEGETLDAVAEARARDAGWR